jgi:hypothetical protein
MTDMGSISATLFCVGLPPGLSDFTHSTLEHRAVIPAQAGIQWGHPVIGRGLNENETSTNEVS